MILSPILPPAVPNRLRWARQKKDWENLQKSIERNSRPGHQKASGLLTLAENLKTDKAFRHVHIVYIYRFVHHGKVESEWKIGHMTNISRSGVDYHPPKDIPYVVKEGINKLVIS